MCTFSLADLSRAVLALLNIREIWLLFLNIEWYNPNYCQLDPLTIIFPIPLGVLYLALFLIIQYQITVSNIQNYQ